MKPSALFAPLLAATLLAACSSPAPPPQKTPPAPKAAASTAMTGTPLDPLLRAENKARNVQKTVNAQAAAQRKAIEKQTQ